MSYRAENITMSVLITLGIVASVYIIGVLILFPMSEQYQENIHSEKMACMANAQTDAVLISCKGELG